MNVTLRRMMIVPLLQIAGASVLIGCDDEPSGCQDNSECASNMCVNGQCSSPPEGMDSGTSPQPDSGADNGAGGTGGTGGTGGIGGAGGMDGKDGMGGMGGMMGGMGGDGGVGGEGGMGGEGRLPTNGSDIGIQWLRIDGGSFDRGSAPDIHPDNEDESPVLEVEVPTFYLTRTEITVAQYRHCVEEGDCQEPALNSGTDLDLECNYETAGADNHPVNCVTWNDAAAFAGFVGARLPTESEWEFAATSRGQGDVYAWGDEIPTCTLASFNDAGGEGFACGTADPPFTSEVCAHEQGNSTQGVCDLNGNVEEWVQDYYGNYAMAPVDGSANQLPGRVVERVIRGGSFASQAHANLRSNHRHHRAQDFKAGRVGIRLAINAP